MPLSDLGHNPGPAQLLYESGNFVHMNGYKKGEEL